MKKRVWTILLLVAVMVFSCIFTGQSQYSFAVVASPGNREQKIYSSATIDQDFDGSSVLVVMDKNVGGINKVHKSSFFGNFEKVSIKDLTAITGNAVTKQYLNVDGFRQILQIKLPRDDKQEVLNVIRKLEKIDGILCAEPNYIIDVIDEQSLLEHFLAHKER